MDKKVRTWPVAACAAHLITFSNLKNQQAVADSLRTVEIRVFVSDFDGNVLVFSANSRISLMGRKLNYHVIHRCQDTLQDYEGDKNGIEMPTVRPINLVVWQAEITMKKRADKYLDEPSDGWEPPWMDSSNDPKTPYTEKELEQFAEGFISSMGDTEILKSMIEKEGMEKVMEVVKERFRKQDERNLVNMITGGSVH